VFNCLTFIKCSGIIMPAKLQIFPHVSPLTHFRSGWACLSFAQRKLCTTCLHRRWHKSILCCERNVERLESQRRSDVSRKRSLGLQFSGECEEIRRQFPVGECLCLCGSALCRPSHCWNKRTSDISLSSLVKVHRIMLLFFSLALNVQQR